MHHASIVYNALLMPAISCHVVGNRITGDRLREVDYSGVDTTGDDNHQHCTDDH